MRFEHAMELRALYFCRGWAASPKYWNSSLAWEWLPYYLQRIEQIEEQIPSSVLVGVFCVGCEDIKSSLKATVRGVTQLLLDVLAKR